MIARKANISDRSTEHLIAWPALRKADISDDLLTQFDAEHDRPRSSRPTGR